VLLCKGNGLPSSIFNEFVGFVISQFVVHGFAKGKKRESFSGENFDRGVELNT
jgi:hypothetical protein